MARSAASWHQMTTAADSSTPHVERRVPSTHLGPALVAVAHDEVRVGWGERVRGALAWAGGAGCRSGEVERTSPRRQLHQAGSGSACCGEQLAWRHGGTCPTCFSATAGLASCPAKVEQPADQIAPLGSHASSVASPFLFFLYFKTVGVPPSSPHVRSLEVLSTTCTGEA